MGFVRQSYRMQMFVAFLIATLSLIIFGGILTVQGFQANVKADYEKRDAEQELLVNERISSMLDSVEETFDRIAQNEILCNSFSKGRKNSIEIYAALYDESQNVRSFGVVELYIGSVCMYSTKVGYKSETLPEYYAILHAASNSGGKTVYSLDPQNISGNEPDLLIAREIVNKDYPGYAIIRIEQETLREQLSGALNARDGYMLVNNLFQSLCLMGTAEDEKSLNLIRSNLFDGKLYNDGFESNIYMTEIGDTGLLSIYITPPAMDASAVRAGYQIIIILAIISVIVCLIVANQLSNYVAKPIGTLAAGMRKFRKGDFDAKIELDREDEFEQLAVGFNKMTTQLKETMEERVTAERRVNETRIKMMQAQLNPHFLYNTLDTIKWVAKANQVPEVATMSASLAGILRTSISQNQFIKLAEEIKLIENYCEIQRIRFDDKFTIIGIPFGKQFFKIARVALFPFGAKVVRLHY